MSIDSTSILALGIGREHHVRRLSLKAVEALIKAPHRVIRKRHPERRFRVRATQSGVVVVTRIQDQEPVDFDQVLAEATEESEFPHENPRNISASVTIKCSEPFANFCESQDRGQRIGRLWHIPMPHGPRSAADFADILDSYGIACRMRKSRKEKQ